MASIGGVLKLSKDRIKGYRNFTTKLWNACRFAEMNGVFEGGGVSARPTPERTVNIWIIGEVARARETVDAALTEYRFNDAANCLYAFVWGKVCDWYVEFAKPLLADDNPAQAETRETMAWVLEQCMILLHPITPFVTEELWQTLVKGETMLPLTEWPSYSTDLIDAQADREMNWVIDLIDEIRSVRAQMHVPVGARIPMLATTMNDTARTAWSNNETLIMRLARIESLGDVGEFPKGCVTVAAEGATFGLPLADVIDVAEEKARLEKTLGKLDKEMGGLKGRLGNPKFIESAPEDVVDESRARLEQGTEEAEKLRAALARLAELA